jgi:hypothetical protein
MNLEPTQIVGKNRTVPNSLFNVLAVIEKKWRDKEEQTKRMRNSLFHLSVKGEKEKKKGGAFPSGAPPFFGLKRYVLLRT